MKKFGTTNKPRNPFYDDPLMRKSGMHIVSKAKSRREGKNACRDTDYLGESPDEFESRREMEAMSWDAWSMADYDADDNYDDRYDPSLDNHLDRCEERDYDLEYDLHGDYQEY